MEQRTDKVFVAIQPFADKERATLVNEAADYTTRHVVIHSNATREYMRNALRDGNVEVRSPGYVNGDGEMATPIKVSIDPSFWQLRPDCEDIKPPPEQTSRCCDFVVPYYASRKRIPLVVEDTRRNIAYRALRYVISGILNFARRMLG